MSVAFGLGGCGGWLVVGKEIYVFDLAGLNLWEVCGDDVVQESEDTES